MPPSDSSRDPEQPASQETGEPVQYPIDHVVAILDTPEQTRCAVEALVEGGFLESEVQLGRGAELADRFEAGTGRQGVQDWLIRMFERVGLKNAETELKERYEQALRDNRSVVAVLTPTEERKDLAARLLRECGARFINFFGRLNVQRMAG